MVPDGTVLDSRRVQRRSTASLQLRLLPRPQPGPVCRGVLDRQHDRGRPLRRFGLPGEQTGHELPGDGARLIWPLGFEMGHGGPRRPVPHLLRHPDEPGGPGGPGVRDRDMAIVSTLAGRRVPGLCQHHGPATPLLRHLLALVPAVSLPLDQDAAVPVRRQEHHGSVVLDGLVHVVHHGGRRVARAHLEETQCPDGRHVRGLSVRNLRQRCHLRQRHLRGQHYGYLTPLQERPGRVGDPARRLTCLCHPHGTFGVYHGGRQFGSLR